MKASLKFREDQRPLARAKIPISIFGLPFLAGAAAGDPRELRLDLTTAFQSGPSFRISYRPNDSSNAFTLAVKTGIGAFGSPVASPVASPMSMTTEFNLLAPRGGTGCPGFSVVFKPRLGDFCFKKSASSPLLSASKIVPAADQGVDGEKIIPPPSSPALITNGIHSVGKVNGFAAESPTALGSFGGLLSGIEVKAGSVLPIHRCAAVRFQWGVRVPHELLSSLSIDRINVATLPMLVMSKISIERIPDTAKAKEIESSSRSPATDELAHACMPIRRELASMQAESEALRKAVEDLRDKINGTGAKKMSADGNKDKLGAKLGKLGKKAAVPDSTMRELKKSTPDDVNEELKKALMSATAAAASGK